MRFVLRSSFRGELEKHAPALARVTGSKRPGKRDLDEWFELLKTRVVTLARIEQVRWRPARGWSEEVGESLEPLLRHLDSVRAFRLGLLSGAMRLERRKDGVRDYATYHGVLRHWGKARNRVENLDLNGLHAQLAQLELDDPYAEDALTLSALDGEQPPLAVIKRLGAERDRRMAREKLTPLERAEQLHRRFSRQKNAVRRIAKLHVSSGAIVACDPQGQLDEGPFARRVPKGEHPVELLLEGGSRRPTVVGARVVVGPGQPLRWEVALQRGQDPDDAGYPVDSALGCFTDAVTLRALAKQVSRLSPDEEEEATTRFLRALKKNRGIWLEQRPDGAAGNLVVFSTGLGDGSYLSFWGLDAQGRPAVLLTDFDA